MEQEYRVGIYARLSRDDERQGESVSIENQKLMLGEFCLRQGWEVKEVFVDDGWSGTNFDRPGFRRLIEAVRGREVNLVLVKDLSRLGRDYIEVGKYTDCVFPYYGCRFVALNDGVDTLRQTDEISMIFKNVINDIYARDTSKKIRAVRRANAESGKYMGYKAPYGYQKSPEDKHCLVIDPEAAEVVRRIFALRLAGRTPKSIADELSMEGILPPKEYAAHKKGKQDRSLGIWKRETIRWILENEVYTGTLVQLRQGSISYKDHRQKRNPRETWARVEGTHEPIVDRETWAAVQKTEKRRAPCKEEATSFSGLVYCKVCGKPMKRIVNRKQRKSGMQTYTYYICREHRGDGVTHCISEGKLLAAVETGLGKEIPPGEGAIIGREKELLRFACLLEEGRKKGLISRETYDTAALEYDQKRREIEAEKRMVGQERSLDIGRMVDRVEVDAEQRILIIWKKRAENVFPEGQCSFVPFGQDDAANKPTSLIADFTKISETVDGALRGEQIQPILLR